MRALLPLTVAGLAISACGDGSADTTLTVPPTPRIIVTSVAGDPQSELLAAIYSRVLEDAGFRVVRRDPVNLDRAGYIAALQDGDIQLIPDWSGDLLSYLSSLPDAPTAPTTVVPNGPATTAAPVTVPTTTTLPPTTTTVEGATTTSSPSTDTTDNGTGTSSTSVDTSSTSVDTSTTVEGATTTVEGATTTSTTIAPNGRATAEQLIALTAALPEGIATNSGSLAEKNRVIACTDDAFSDNDDVVLSTYSHLASIAPRIELGAPADWQSDEEFGLPAWAAFYGGEFDEISTVEADGIAAAADDGDADCFVVDSLDSVITTSNLTVLIDDLSMVRSNVAIALISSSIGTPDVLGALDVIVAALTTERLNQMLNQIATNGTDPAVVANAFVDSI
jgi:glycine betaine/choline ABC-type transport system substrate-binding protein